MPNFFAYFSVFLLKLAETMTHKTIGFVNFRSVSTCQLAGLLRQKYKVGDPNILSVSNYVALKNELLRRPKDS